jgi:SAM-dependent methyltransferase
VFVPEAQWVSVAEERRRYAHHDNTAANAGYVRFLGEVAEVVCGLTASDASVLDFGSGENRVLTEMLGGRGRRCRAYDPLYGLGDDALLDRYDAIVLCEVIEHLRDLRGELARLGGCLRPGGHVVVRTQCYPSLAEIPSWWYARDITHLNFFAPRTLERAAGLLGLQGQSTNLRDVVVWGAG